MNDAEFGPITRRESLKGAAAAAALAFSGTLGTANSFSADQPATGPNLIQQENARPGATDWQLTRVRVDKSDGCRSPAIEGYCSQAERGGGREARDHGHHRIRPAKFKIEIFRTGYYGGRGARLMTTLGPFEGKPQPVPTPDRADHARVPLGTGRRADDPRRLAERRLSRAGSPRCRPSDDQPYWQSYVIFIVRDDRPADVLFQCSDNTWQAYNGWPVQVFALHAPQGGHGPVGRRELRSALRPRGPVLRASSTTRSRSAPASS